jgi:dephospho-CoA kinase
MLSIGITGSIAMGKSFLLKHLKKLRISVHDADLEVAKILLTSKDVFKKISTNFPDVIINNNIDKVLLAKEIYSNKKSLKILENIIHPIVSLNRRIFINKLRYKRIKFAFFDIPLLYEKKLSKEFKYVIVATAPKFLQTRRALSRKNMNLTKLRAINNNQMKDYKKRQLADFVINTGANKATIVRSLKKFLNEKL